MKNQNVHPGDLRDLIAKTLEDLLYLIVYNDVNENESAVIATRNNLVEGIYQHLDALHGHDIGQYKNELIQIS